MVALETMPTTCSARVRPTGHPLEFSNAVTAATVSEGATVKTVSPLDLRICEKSSRSLVHSILENTVAWSEVSFNARKREACAGGEAGKRMVPGPARAKGPISRTPIANPPVGLPGDPGGAAGPGRSCRLPLRSSSSPRASRRPSPAPPWRNRPGALAADQPRRCARSVRKPPPRPTTSSCPPNH